MIWIGRRREKELLRLSERHLNKIISLADKLRALMKSFRTNDRKSMVDAFKEIFKLEREADDEKEKIITELSKGPFHPMDREDIMRLILTMDDIAANIKAASRKLLYLSPERIPEQVKNDLTKMAEMIYDIVDRLREAHGALIEGSKDALKLADKVERMEEEIDDFRVEFIARVLEWGEKADCISCLLMLKEAIENLENAADKSEDVADIIRGIVAVGGL